MAKQKSVIISPSARARSPLFRVLNKNEVSAPPSNLLSVIRTPSDAEALKSDRTYDHAIDGL